MSSSAKLPSQFQAVLKLHGCSAPDLVLRARAIVEAMTGSSWFPSPTPSLAILQAAIDDLFDAQTTTLTRVKGSVVTRDEKRRVLEMKLEQLRSYVEGIAYANREHAGSIIESAGMYVKDARGPGAPVFTAKAGRVSGEVNLRAPQAGNRGAYEFQYSLDEGVTWLTLPQPVTTKATATVADLKPGAKVLFRYRTTVKGVTGNWSDVVWCFVS